MALTDKVLMLGVDGLDPTLTRKFVDQGKLPNIQKFIERGAQKHDLKLLCTLQRSLPHCGRRWLPAHCLSPTASPVSGVRIHYTWTPLATTSTAVSAKQSHCGMLPQKPA